MVSEKKPDLDRICLRPESILGARLEQGVLVVLVNAENVKTGSGIMECLSGRVKVQYLDPKIDPACDRTFSKELKSPARCEEKKKNDDAERVLCPGVVVAAEGRSVVVPADELLAAVTTGPVAVDDILERYGLPMSRSELADHVELMRRRRQEGV